MQGKKNNQAPERPQHARLESPESQQNHESPKNNRQIAHVEKRLLLFFPGFETLDSQHLLERFNNSAQRTAKLWGFESEQRSSGVQDWDASNVFGTATQISRQGNKKNGWSVSLPTVVFDWHSIISAYEKGYPLSLLRNLPKYLAYFADGTWLRYAKVSGRYAAYAAYPLVFMLIFFAIGFGLATALEWGLFGGLLAGLVTWLGLTLWPGEKFFINKTIGNWAFGRDLMLGKNPALATKKWQFTQALSKAITDFDGEEIIVLAHSFGTVWALQSLAQACRQSPDLLRGKSLCFVAAGSSILKLSLSPSGADLVADLKAIGEQSARNDGAMIWYEIQSKADVVSFYRSDPFKEHGITFAGLQQMTHIKLAEGLEGERRKRARRSPYRMHRQYILHNDRKVFWDVLARVLSPLPQEMIIESDAAFSALWDQFVAHKNAPDA